jgi:hypothetical protein
MIAPEPRGRLRVQATETDQKVLIKLTDEQRHAIRELTGKDADCIECTQEELEMKLAPCLPCAEHLHGLWVVLGLDD